MNRTLVNAFYERWPTWFAGLHDSPVHSCLAFGFECGDGWRDILWNLCQDLERIGVPDDFLVTQVKEKFGGLRFYTSGCSDEAYNRISEAETQSYLTCDQCGQPGKPETRHGWISTRCPNCWERT